MSENVTKIAVLTERVDTIEETLQGMAGDVRVIREAIAESRGALRAFKYATHGLAVLGGIVAGYFGHKGTP